MAAESELPGDRPGGPRAAPDPAGFDEDRIPLLRESPATVVLGGLWVLVFLVMAWEQGAFTPGGFRPLVQNGISTAITRVFGDQTPAAIASGHIWRALTSTFIHFGLTHLGLNLLGFVLFGRMVEGWYGSGPFVAIYATIGLVGNLLSGLLKLAIGTDPLRPSGGGSGVAVGLIALIAVAGWRSRSRFGQFVRAQMLGLLLLLGVMGYYFPSHDNLGHATGAVVGVLIGLWHPVLLRTRPATRRILGGLGVTVLVACVAAQVDEVRTARRLVLDQQRHGRLVAAMVEVARAHACYRELTRRGSHELMDLTARAPIRPRRSDLRLALGRSLNAVESLGILPRDGPAADAFRRLRTLAGQAQERSPTPGEFHAFDQAAATVLLQIRQEGAAIESRLRAHGVRIQ